MINWSIFILKIEITNDLPYYLLYFLTCTGFDLMKRNKKNNNVLQSEAYLLLADTKSSTHNLTLEWYWPCDAAFDLVCINNQFPLHSLGPGTQTWVRYGQYLQPYLNRRLCTDSSKIVKKNTHRHADTMKTLPQPHMRNISVQHMNWRRLQMW